MKNSFLAKTLLVTCIAALGASSSLAAFVTFQLNPGNENGNVGANSRLYNVSGFQITAYGFDNVAGPDPARELYYKFQAPIGGAGERGLGLVGTDNNELQVNPDGTPANYIQLDLRSILEQEFTDGEVMVGSVQPSELFRIYGSNALGTLGTQLGPDYGNAFDEKFVSIASFGSFSFISVASGNVDVLPVAFRAMPIPEMNALFPIVGLVALVAATHLVRRRSARL